LRDAGIHSGVVAKLVAFVDGAEDRDLLRIRPYELADEWKMSRRTILSAFLTATRLGLFNLRWSVLCPGCRGPSPPIDSLAQLHRGYHCEACNLPFDAAFDRSVEVTFDARPLGRGTEPGLFCIANPQRSTHVYAQFSIAPHALHEFALALPRGSYELNVVGAATSAFISSDDENVGELTARIHSDGGLQVGPCVGSGDVRVRIANESDREAVVRIEDGRWPDTIATAAQVTALQEFRDLFSSEVLAPGLDLGIETLAVLFTDVVGSTAIYSKTGDAPAFRIVTDHFDVMRDTVTRHEGTIVKTIGDAVMAAFTDPLHCLEAALDLDARVQSITAAGRPLRLRVGFHVGPCIAMRANDRIDYFGTTVNLAARLQKLADVGQVTLARSVADRPAIAARLGGLSTSIANETLEIKGFPQRIDVVRIFT
jgi:class 3 adenylate cyclase